MNVELLTGRFQPIHNGHKKIIDSMINPIVVIVKGKKSSEDKERNPLSEDYQKKLLEKVCPGVEVSVSPNGFLPGILGYFRKQGKEVTKIYAGADRINGYKSAIETANSKMPKEDQYHVKFQETERITSASAVRKAIKENDFLTFKKLVPEQIWSEWNNLKKIFNEVTELKNFSNWLKEEVQVTTSTNNIKTAQKDQPLINNITNRKMKKLIKMNEE